MLAQLQKVKMESAKLRHRADAPVLAEATANTVIGDSRRNWRECSTAVEGKDQSC